MPLRAGAAKHREIMVKIGLDASAMEVPAEKAKQYIQELVNTTKSGNRQMTQATNQTTSATKNLMNAWGRMRMRRAPITLMTTEFARLANTMTLTAGSGNLVRTAMYGLTYTLSPMVGTIGIAVMAISGLVASFMALKLRTGKSSKAFKEFEKKLKDAKEEQKKLNEEIQRYNEIIQTTAISGTDIFSGKVENATDAFKEFFVSAEQATDGLFYFNVAMSDAHSALAKMTDSQARFFRVMDPLMQKRKRELELLELQAALIENRSIPNLRALIKYYDREIDRIKKSLAGTIIDIEKRRELNDLLRNRIALQKELEKVLEEEQKEGLPYVYKAPKLKDVSKAVFPEGARELGRRQEEELRRERRLAWEAQYARGMQAYESYLKDRLELLKAYGEEWSEEYALIMEKIGRIQQTKDEKRIREQQRFQMAVMSYVDQFSAAWIDTFRGVENAFGQMLQNMINRLMSSALTSMIMGILFPEVGFMGFFKKLVGFQYGTPYVPKTGPYLLHRGEAVVPASRNISYIRNYNTGGNTQNYYLLNLDVENLTRRQIVPIIEQMAQNRQTRISVI